MSKAPSEIARHRLPGTEIKCIRGHYYLQRVTSKWDPKARKTRKITLGYLGRVTPEGLVPRKTRRIPADAKPYSKEFGATWALQQLTPDILEALEKHFPGDAKWLYATTLIRCIRHCAMRYTEHFYEVSLLSESMPGLRLSSGNLSNLMTSLSYRRRQMVAFMREFVPSRDNFLIFDGRAIVCNSGNIAEVQRGYNSHGRHDPQTVYRTYKMREETEQLFDTYKAEEDFNTTGMHSAETQEAALPEHIA